MHDQGVAHGNLKGVCFIFDHPISHKADLPLKSNIMIKNDGHACLAGFSLLTAIPDELAITSSNPPSDTTQWMHSVQWAAPEILAGGISSKETDVFAFAMIIIEVHHERSTTLRFFLTVASFRSRCSVEQPR